MVKKEEDEKAKKDEKEGRWTKFEKIGSIYHSKNEIRKMLLPILKYESEPDKFSNQPKIKSPYNSGKLSEETKNIALQYLNSYRFCAGIPCDVKIDSSYEKLAQDAALLMKVNNLLEHTGQPKPRNMNDNLYKSGSKGCSSCNIALGYSNLFTAINGWILDDGLISVGHRRWILNPPMTKTGFGGVSNFHAMYSFDGDFQNTEYKNIPWPCTNMPIEYGKTEYWCLSVGKNVKNDVEVTLTNKNNGKIQKFSNKSNNFCISNDNVGLDGCISFIGPSSCKDGDSYRVDVKGSNVNVSYDVNFFNVRNRNY